MSNVLIGIIGVVLFIGLAIAGASFLGPRFSQSTNMSKAAAIVTGLDQMANAVKLRKTSTGSSGSVGSPAYLVTEGYLKALPQNAFGSGTGVFEFRDANGLYNGSAAYAIGGMSAGTIEHIDTCKEINRISNVGGTTGTPPTASAPPGRMGCFITNGWGSGSIPNRTLVVYRKL